MEDIAANLAAVRARIAEAAGVVGRDPGEVRLLLAVKNQPVDAVRAALAAGADLLGHNRVQEAATIGAALAESEVPPHETHFIGRLQSNKVSQVLRWVSCVQGVDSARLAERLAATVARAGRPDDGPAQAAGTAQSAGAAQAASAGQLGQAASAGQPGQAAGTDQPGQAAVVDPLDVLVQVNVSGEATKAGCSPAEAVELCAAVGRLPQLRLRGLMTIGAHSADLGVVRAGFEHLAALRAEVLASGAPGTETARELSMGMSGDLEAAIAAGATIVRVGTAVFGAR
ncbi:YggS family pyridoxal phosphate enzyme [Georgenia sp. TF02-10]|uniref:YggS family pyridoxal phosphate enzyme n=1 Tax=Georgenia sp. TF02-10 TaxID=2917725 RepID=UPI001FA78FD4|nr:YggS family pyridoxal phosphate enzyme [Georgenia sp. TF02-10]UNX53899.1 YggS family pyridoxal phosphate enzyme [Georgenia sp. TF02-10]